MELVNNSLLLPFSSSTGPVNCSAPLTLNPHEGCQCN
nr:MAG TPA: hypothetical protein [Caudoviricetes sp.]